MPDTDSWLTEYGNSHRDVNLPAVYWLSVLILVAATVGMFSLLPIPEEFARISPVLNWATAFLMAAVVYYFIISISLAIGMLPFVFGLTALQIWLADSTLPVDRIVAGLFVASLAGIAVGHYSRGGIKSVLTDIQMMMIAPIWILSRLYRRIGIPY
jgi:hypothetical protein